LTEFIVVFGIVAIAAFGVVAWFVWMEWIVDSQERPHDE
jgi:hypothetical protein